MSKVSDKLVSEQLFRNKLVRDYVHDNGTDGVCSYTGVTSKVLPLRLIAEYVDSIILQYYGDPDNEAVGWDSGFEDDTPGFHCEGGGYILPNGKHYYDDMSDLLSATDFAVNNDELERDIIDALSYHVHLVEKDPYGLDDEEIRLLDWHIIKDRAMEMARTGSSVDEIIAAEAARLKYLRDDIYAAHYPLQTEKHLTLYRTVNYDKKLWPVLFGNLTSPPAEYARDLRMNVAGDSVFYGAINKETALEEAIRENGDRYTYIGKFETKHPLLLLDLTGIPTQLTIYDQKLDQYYLLSFLRKFCDAVSEYVPDHDAVMYAPTQVVTYYFRKKLLHYKKDGSFRPIDGILYTSSKNGGTDVVLFFDNESSAQHLELKEWEVQHQGKTMRHKYRGFMKYIEKIWKVLGT